MRHVLFSRDRCSLVETRALLKRTCSSPDPETRVSSQEKDAQGTRSGLRTKPNCTARGSAAQVCSGEETCTVQVGELGTNLDSLLRRWRRVEKVSMLRRFPTPLVLCCASFVSSSPFSSNMTGSAMLTTPVSLKPCCGMATPGRKRERERERKRERERAGERGRESGRRTKRGREGEGTPRAPQRSRAGQRETGMTARQGRDDSEAHTRGPGRERGEDPKKSSSATCTHKPMQARATPQPFAANATRVAPALSQPRLKPPSAAWRLPTAKTRRRASFGATRQHPSACTSRLAPTSWPSQSPNLDHVRRLRTALFTRISFFVICSAKTL